MKKYGISYLGEVFKILNKLRVFVKDYSQNITVAMLFDLCNAVGIKPSELIGENKLSPNSSNLKVSLCEKSEKKENETMRVQETVYSKATCTDLEKRLNSNRYLTCDEVAEFFGVKKSTIWLWIRTKQLKAISFGNNYRIHPGAVKEFEASKQTQQEETFSAY